MMLRWIELLWIPLVPLALIGIVRLLYFVCGIPYDLHAAHVALGIAVIVGMPVGGVIGAIRFGNH